MSDVVWSLPGFAEIKTLGEGGQGRVVLARHLESGEAVAIKYLAADLLAGGLGHFRVEAHMLARVASPHVARLKEFVEDPRGAAIVMEAVDGVSLRDLLAVRTEPLTPEASLVVLKGSLLGLGAAHAIGVVHRDYKPANVIVRGDGCSKLIDFGIATLAGVASQAGTRAYMAPEQWEGRPAGPATDVYAATCVFYECVMGQRPYLGNEAVVLMQQHLMAPVPLERVPEPLRPLVAAGMAKQAEQRPADAAAFVTALDTAATSAYGPDWEQRGVRALAGAAAGLAALFPLGLAVAKGAGAKALAGGTLAAKVSGAKLTLAVAGLAVAGSVGTVAVVALHSGDDKRPAAVNTQSSPAQPPVTKPSTTPTPTRPANPYAGRKTRGVIKFGADRNELLFTRVKQTGFEPGNVHFKQVGGYVPVSLAPGVRIRGTHPAAPGWRKMTVRDFRQWVASVRERGKQLRGFNSEWEVTFDRDGRIASMFLHDGLI